MSKTLNSEAVDTIRNASSIAALLGIKELIVDTDGIRGVDDDRSVLIYDDEEISLGKGISAFGITNTDELTRRINFYYSKDESLFTVNIKDDGFCSLIDMSSQSDDTLTTRLANPTHIKAPTSIKFTPSFSFELNEDTVSQLKDAIMLIKSEEISMGVKDGLLHFLRTSKDNDSKLVPTDIEVEFLDDDQEFNFTYKSTKLITMFSANQEGTYQVGINGMLQNTYDDVAVFILPQY